MGKLHLRNVVFPAVLLSCSIFSTLTLPFVLSDPNPVTVKLPPFFQGEIQPIFTDENKTFTIRYIGAAIVISVSTGLLTVEVLRRVQNQDQEEASALQSNESGSDAISQVVSETGDDLPGYGFNLDSFTSLPALVEEFSDVFSSEAVMSPAEISHIAVLDAQGTTCRIKTLDSEQTELALMWNGEYYRFFRVRQTQEKAMAIAKKLTRQGEEVVVSHLEHGYAIWVREAEVAAELVSQGV